VTATDEDKEQLKKAMRMAAFFADWREIVDQNEFRNKTGKQPCDMFEAYEKGQMKATEVLKPVVEHLRLETEEAQERQPFFKDLSELAENVDNPKPEGGKKRGRKRKKKSVAQSG